MPKPVLNFFGKVLTYFVIISIIPLGILGASYYLFSNNLLKNEIIKQVQSNAENISNNIDILLEEYSRIVSVLSNDSDIIRLVTSRSVEDDLEQKIYQKVYLSFVSKENIASVYIISKDGNTNISTRSIPEVYNIRKYNNWGIFRKANDSIGECVVYTQSYTDSSGNNIVLSIAKTLQDEKGNIIGYVIVDVYETYIYEICNNNTGSISMETIVVDKNFYTVSNQRNRHSQGNIYNTPFRERIRNEKTGYIIDSNNGTNNLITYRTSIKTGNVTIGIVPMNILDKNNYFIRIITLTACIGSIVICLIFAFLLSRSISNPIKKLVKCMKKVEAGDLSARVNFKRNDEIGVLGGSFNKMISRVGELLESVYEKQKRIRVAEVKALQAQINPHFLYNTLDSIKWIAKLNNVNDICTIVTHLGKLLRYNISCESEFVTVEESIAIIECYVGIQKIRHCDKFNTKINVDENIKQCIIPKLIFQPIVENSITHGLENKIEGGLLIINAYKHDNDIIIEVNDNGQGIEQETVERINKGETIGASTSSGIGMENVHKRIKLYYGENYGLNVVSRLGEGTNVSLRMPFILKGGD